ncbi:hypothetical protein EV702DRAFT_1137388 [Suillus placidus]|uniref:Secreted protein n=1 Tax=Suillus placidus TaxID=48579 RepID=A0A9P6ZND9_9AGAM|nr:hypothetical protein EV702DRAFT_1137388 [Suillus placidus]
MFDLLLLVLRQFVASAHPLTLSRISGHRIIRMLKIVSVESLICIVEGYYYDLVCILGRLFTGQGGLTVDILPLSHQTLKKCPRGGHRACGLSSHL